MSRLMIVEVPSYSCEFKGIREICEVVPCGECIHWNPNEEEEPKPCSVMFAKPTYADDYCSYGERSEQ